VGHLGVPTPLGGPPRKLVDAAAGLRWSPQGDRIAFVRPRPVGGDLLLVAGADGQDERVLIPGAEGVHVHQPAWSPDGSRIFFTRALDPNNGSHADIWQVSSAGGAPEPVVLTRGRAQCALPLPDGAGLIYAGDLRGEGLNLWQRPFRSGRARRLTTGAGESTEPRLSRDGTRLVCTVGMSLSLVPADAGKPATAEAPLATLTGSSSGDAEPSVNPRTGQVVFSSSRNGIRNLWILDPGAREPRQLTSSGEVDEGPVLSPAGSRWPSCPIATALAASGWCRRKFVLGSASRASFAQGAWVRSTRRRTCSSASASRSRRVRAELASKDGVIESLEGAVARRVTHHNVCRLFDLGVHVPPQSGG